MSILLFFNTDRQIDVRYGLFNSAIDKFAIAHGLSSRLINSYKGVGLEAGRGGGGIQVSELSCPTSSFWHNKFKYCFIF